MLCACLWNNNLPVFALAWKFSLRNFPREFLSLEVSSICEMRLSLNLTSKMLWIVTSLGVRRFWNYFCYSTDLKMTADIRVVKHEIIVCCGEFVIKIRNAQNFNARKSRSDDFSIFWSRKKRNKFNLKHVCGNKTLLLPVKFSLSISARRWFGEEEGSSIVKFNVTIIHIFTSCCFSSELAKKPWRCTKD